MLRLFVFLIYLAGNVVSTDKQFNCTWPKDPKNGYFTNVYDRFFDEDLLPDPRTNKVKSYKLKIWCKIGFAGIAPTPIRSDLLICHEDGRMEYADFECLPICAQSSILLSCGSESRCVMTSGEPVTTFQTTSRYQTQENYGECGVPDPFYEDLQVARDEHSRSRRDVHMKYGGMHYEEPETTTLRRGSFSGSPTAGGGRRSSFAEIPWHAGVYSKKSRPYMQICGGTLVSNTVVISAAHCFWGEDKQLPATDYAVAVGKLYRPWNEAHDVGAQKSHVAAIKIPPYFKGHATNLQEDIAVVIVQSPFKFGYGVQPACLDFDEEMDQQHLAQNVLGVVAGWGLTSEDGPASPVLQIVELPVLDVQECFQQADPTFRGHITSDKFCAGWNNGTAVCKGDSGGGFFVRSYHRYEPRFYLRGVVSGAPQNEHLCNLYSWASFTRVYNHERFIKKAIEEAYYAGSSNKPLH